MKVQKVPVKKIIPHPSNPRILLTEKDPEYQQIKKSIKSYGLVEPLVWNEKTGHLISGHQRLSVLRAEGIEEVEAVIVDFDEKREKELMIALNRISGRWDYEKLSILLEEFTKMPDFDFESIGFNLPDVSNILDNYHQEEYEDSFDVNVALETIDTPITAPGDLIILGEHKLLCGDSTRQTDLDRLMNGAKADMLFCDPPYGVSLEGGNRPVLKRDKKKCKHWKPIINDNLSEEKYATWLKKVFINMDRYLAPGAPAYIFNAHKQFSVMHSLLTKLNYHVSCVITWDKLTPSLSFADYNQQTEFILYAWKKENGPHRWYGPTNETTLWRIKRDNFKDYQHITQKPVALPARGIKNSSLRDNIILELFGGSGSTLVACEKLKRKCYCMEIEPINCDLIVRRYIALKGKNNVPDKIKQVYLKEGR